jgi:hypothetical protein
MVVLLPQATLIYPTFVMLQAADFTSLSTPRLFKAERLELRKPLADVTAKRKSSHLISTSYM